MADEEPGWLRSWIVAGGYGLLGCLVIFGALALLAVVVVGCGMATHGVSP